MGKTEVGGGTVIEYRLLAEDGGVILWDSGTSHISNRS